VAIAARQRAVEAIVEQNALLIEKNNIFLQKQQARTDVFNGWGINSQHKIPQEIVKSLDPE
jgi:trehalose utilization protein